GRRVRPRFRAASSRRRPSAAGRAPHGTRGDGGTPARAVCKSRLTWVCITRFVRAPPGLVRAPERSVRVRGGSRKVGGSLPVGPREPGPKRGQYLSGQGVRVDPAG